jgi:photosystem II stability/assembly factor-like uncharacterized protein
MLHRILPLVLLIGLSATLGTAASPTTQNIVRVGPYALGKLAVTYTASVDPRDSNIIVVGARPQGILRSTDRGATWAHVSANMKTTGDVGPNPKSLTRSASQPDRLYVGIETLGAWRSDDNGQTWRKLIAGIPRGAALHGVSMVVHPTNPDIVYYGSDSGIFKSIDGGVSWKRLTRGLPTGRTKINKEIEQTISGIFLDPANPDHILIGIYGTGDNEPAGMWASSDGGESWTPSSHGIDAQTNMQGVIPLRDDYVLDIASSATSPNTFLITTPSGLYRSDDFGADWKKLPKVSFAPSAVAVDTNDAQTLFVGAGDGSLHLSRDAGASWTDITGPLPTGRDPAAQPIDIDFLTPDGKTHHAQGFDRKYQNMIYSIYPNADGRGGTYIAARAGLYRLEVSKDQP